MAWGISPYKKVIIPLGGYNASHYLTLLYTSMDNLGWHISYFNHDGIIAYTDISWPSYAEEVSVRVHDKHIIIKSECVGYQALFTDYGKNKKNLDRLFYDMEFTEQQLEPNLEQTTQALIDDIPENQFINLSDPPLGGKEKLHSFLSLFTPQPRYFVTPILVLINIAIYIISMVALGVAFNIGAKRLTGPHDFDNITNYIKNTLLAVGFSNRSQVLNGEAWRLLTNTFLHFSLGHLLGNMIVLIYIGSLIEEKLGRWNFLFLYLFTGLMASMVSVIWHPDTIAGGASGAIFGLFGILLALLSTNFYERNARRALLISTAIFVGYHLIPGNKQIDFAAHLGGLLSGYILGLIAYWGLSNEKDILRQWGIVTAGSVITAGFVIGSIYFTTDYQLNDYVAMNQKIQRLSNSIKRDFYDNNGMSRKEHLNLIERKTLPELKQLHQLLAQYKQLILPDDKKELSIMQFKIADLEYQLFNLLYKEFKEQNTIKYRQDINNISYQLSVSRSAWQNYRQQQQQ